MKIGKFTLSKEILIVLALIIVGGAYLFYQNTTANSNTNFTFPSLTKVESTEIDKIEIATTTFNATLIKDADIWTISEIDRQADERKMDAMLKSLSSFTFNKVTSNQKERLASRFGLDDTAIEVKAYQGDALLRDLILGINNPNSYLEAYLTFPNDTAVYSVEGIHQDNFPLDFAALRSTQILKFKQEKVSSLSFKTDDKEDAIMIKKQGESWTIDGQNNALSQALGATISSISSLHASTFLDTTGTLQDPAIIVTINEQDGQSHTLSLYEDSTDDETTIYGQSSMSKDDFELSQAIFTRLWDAIHTPIETPNDDEQEE